MKLFAIADLHLSHRLNRKALEIWTARPNDWLILAGDVGGSLERIELGLRAATERFARVFWVPGNHELWSDGRDTLRGVARYDAVVALCRRLGVVTPEDPYVVWPGGSPAIIAPLFLLYDYTFGPDHVPPDEAVAWAAEDGIRCADERYLSPEPYLTRAAWCHARVAATKTRLAEAAAQYPLVLVNHFQLRRELVRVGRIRRFVVWCGTRLTEDWHTRFRARVVVSGHLHVRTTDWIDGVRFEEVSLGYPRHWRQECGIDHYLREILPGPVRTSDRGGPVHYR